MSCIGVHYMISYEQAMKLLHLKSDEDIFNTVQEVLAPAATGETSFDCNAAWDALHRSLSNGTLDPRQGQRPLNMTFLCGNFLTRGEDYIAVLTTPTEVKQIAEAPAKVTEEGLKKKYFDQKFPGYLDKSQSNWEQTWAGFQGLPEFFANAAARKQHVLFTATQ